MVICEYLIRPGSTSSLQLVRLSWLEITLLVQVLQHRLGIRSLVDAQSSFPSRLSSRPILHFVSRSACLTLGSSQISVSPILLLVKTRLILVSFSRPTSASIAFSDAISENSSITV